MVESLGNLGIERPLAPIRALEWHFHELVCVIGFCGRLVELERNSHLRRVLRHEGRGFDHAGSDVAGVQRGSDTFTTGLLDQELGSVWVIGALRDYLGVVWIEGTGQIVANLPIA